MTLRKAVIPVAGMGTRLLPATKSQPKEMLPVGRKPLVQYVVEELRRAELDRILFVTGRGKNSIEDHFDDDPQLVRSLREKGKEDLLECLEYLMLGIEFLYTRQKQPLGLGDAVRYARKFAADEAFVVALGDSIIGNGSREQKNYAATSRLVKAFQQSQADVAILVEEVSGAEISHYGVVAPKGQLPMGRSGDDSTISFEIGDLVEKPDPREAPSNLAIAGRYVFNGKIFEALDHVKPDNRGEIQLTEAIQELAQQGAKVIGVKSEMHERRYDIGNFISYFETFVEFALCDPDYGAEIRKRLPEIVKRVEK